MPDPGDIPDTATLQRLWSWSSELATEQLELLLQLH